MDSSSERAVPGRFWLILLAGDVERNPGPTKYPCTVCSRVVMSKQQGVECTRCERWMHAGYGGISEAECKWLSDHEEEPWFCLDCQPTTDISMDTNSVSETNGCTPFGTGHGYLNCRVLNARSIVNKRLDLGALLISENLDVVAITETFLSEDILDSELVDETAFTIYRQDLNGHGGGIMLVLWSDLSTVRRTDLVKFRW